MSMVIDELVTILGIEEDPKTRAVIQKFSKTIDEVTTSVKIVVGALTAAAGSIAYFTKQSAEATFELDKLSRTTGLNSSMLQEMGFAAQMSGGDFQSMAGDLVNLTKTMSSPIPGEFNQTLFMLGINIKKANGELKTADEVLLDVADKFQGMSKVQQLQWASRLGLSDSTLILLQKGRGEIEKLRKQARDFPLILSEKQLEAAREFVTQWRLMEKVVSFLGQLFVSSILPSLTKITSALTEWVSINKEFIAQGIDIVIRGVIEGFQRFWDVILKVKDAIAALLPDTGGFFEKMDMIKAISAIVSGILLALVGILISFAAEWLAVVAAITAAALVFEDIMTYFQGGDSLIGSLVDKVKELGGSFADEFPAITDLVKALWEVLKGLARVVKDQLVGSFKLLWEVLKPVAKLMKVILGEGAKALESVLGKLGFGKEGAGQRDTKSMLEGLSAFQNKWFNSLSQGIRSFTNPSAPQGGVIGGDRISNTANSQTQMSNQITNNFTISGDNAPAVASEVSHKMNTSLSMTFPGDLAPVTN